MLRVTEANRGKITEDFIAWFIDGCHDMRVMTALASMGLRARMQGYKAEELGEEFSNFGYDEEVADANG